MKRQPRFERNTALEGLLAELNQRLGPAEADLAAKYPRPTRPVLLVVGAPRSGTTLLVQWLAASGQFAYPTNLLSRFFGAPYIGALVQRLITDPKFNFGNELEIAATGPTTFSSELGKTRGLLEPNEFWYFWRRFFPIDQAQRLGADELARVDVAGFLAGLGALQAAYEKPWCMKGILLQFHLEFLHHHIPQVLFLFTTRGLAHNAQSLYEARLKYFGDPAAWFSVRPPGWEALRDREPLYQVTGQVVATNQDIRDQLSRLPAECWIEVEHERFCREPAAYYAQIAARMEQWGCLIAPTYSGPAHFQGDGRRRVSADQQAAIEAAYRQLTGRALGAANDSRPD
jgi:hypothetical protein